MKLAGSYLSNIDTATVLEISQFLEKPDILRVIETGTSLQQSCLEVSVHPLKYRPNATSLLSMKTNNLKDVSLSACSFFGAQIKPSKNTIESIEALISQSVFPNLLYSEHHIKGLLSNIDEQAINSFIERKYEVVQASLASCADYPRGYDYNPDISLDESKWLPEPVKTILRALCLDPVFNCRNDGTQEKLTYLSTVLDQDQPACSFFV
jgi:hypothetical protein